jgi:ADP-heptose:LPS heptosyltransferase
LAPLVSALRDAGHELGVLLSTANAQVFATRAFERVHVVERIPWPAHGSTPTSYERAHAQAVTARYDVALIASEEPEGYRFACSAGIRERVGFVNGWGKPFKSLQTRRLLTRALVRSASATRAGEHEVQTLFRLGEGLHAEARPTRDPRRLRPLIVDDVAREEDARIAFQVVAKTFGGGIEPSAAIAREIARHFPVVVFGSSADAGLTHALASAAGTAEQIFERVAEWREALTRMRAVVTPDSGAAHLAGMAGVPCVDLFRPGRHAAADVMRWSPWASASRTLIAGPEPSSDARAVVASLREILDGR